VKVLYHHRTQGKGVEGIHIREIVKSLRDRSHEVEIISPPGCDPWIKHETTVKPGVLARLWSFISKHSPEILFEILELFYNFYSYKRIHSILTDKKIDFIYERYFLFTVASNVLATRKKIPIIYEVNDACILPRLRKLRLSRLAHCIEKRVFCDAGLIITVSNSLKNKLVESGVSGDKIIVMHNGVDPQLFDRSRYKNNPVICDLPDNKLIIGFVGLFVEWVGLDMLITCFSEIKKRFAETHLLLVGGGPLEGEIKKLIHENNLGSDVTITGILPHEEVPLYINKMDVCVIPKHANYTSPVKMFEYMAMGKAVLAPAYESIQEVIRSGENGVLFKPDNRESFCNSLEQLLMDQNVLKSLGDAAKKDIFANYTWRHNAEMIEWKVRELINK
jgi:glycosyltransferase involved in cell wall biosynthesis